MQGNESVSRSSVTSHQWPAFSGVGCWVLGCRPSINVAGRQDDGVDGVDGGLVDSMGCISLLPRISLEGVAVAGSHSQWCSALWLAYQACLPRVGT